MKRILCTTALLFSIFALRPAFGGDGYVTGDATLRAGPDRSYPNVAMLPAGAEVVIEGCVDGWSWCDVTAGNDRGWVAGYLLQEEYEGRRVRIPEYGVRIGIPVIAFVFGTYWDDNYRNRAWYGERDQWRRITPRHHPGTVPGYRYEDGRVDHHSQPRRASTDAYAPRRAALAAPRATRQHEPTRVRETRVDTQHRRGSSHVTSIESKAATRNADTSAGAPARDSRTSQPGRIAARYVPLRDNRGKHETADSKVAREPAQHGKSTDKNDDKQKE